VGWNNNSKEFLSIKIKNVHAGRERNFDFHSIHSPKKGRIVHGKETTFIHKKIRICAVIKIMKASNIKLISFPNIILSREKKSTISLFLFTKNHICSGKIKSLNFIIVVYA